MTIQMHTLSAIPHQYYSRNQQHISISDKWQHMFITDSHETAAS